MATLFEPLCSISREGAASYLCVGFVSVRRALAVMDGCQAYLGLGFIIARAIALLTQGVPKDRTKLSARSSRSELSIK